MAKAKKLPSGNWRVQLYVGKENGKRLYKSFTAESKKAAEYAAAEYAVKLKEKSSPERIVFKDAAEKYIEDKKSVLSPATIRGYKIMVKNAYETIENERVRDLAEGTILQRWVSENTKKYSAKSLKNQFGFITAVIGYIGFGVPSIRLPQRKKNEIPVPTKKEITKIIELLKNDPEIECQCLLALTCSLRQSEIAALTPNDVDGNTIKIHGARVPDETGKLVYKPTNKSSAGTRETSMPKYLSGLIHKRIESIKDSSEWIFSLYPSTVLKRFKKLLSNNNMPPYTIHSLRHAFAAIMHAQGTPDQYIMQAGGWSSANVMQRIYCYEFTEDSKAAKDTVNNYFDKISHKIQHKPERIQR